ncbi:MAG: glycerol-3-phosphate 1-O-acyltransferase PlsY [Alphaproteobacteria bacterium]|nr:glycerol-3-phosphate 1-O-acyltransferase PlsY [Alphaproteobacteria bacterium]
MLLQAFTLLLAYLIGSAPVGLILATLYADLDVREQGSGNIGATNVLRTTGRTLGAVTLVIDLLKGLLPALLAGLMFEAPEWVAVAGFLAVMGHCFSIYLEFNGGKGVATGAGAMLAVAPTVLLATAAVWGLVFALGRRSSLAALLSLAALQGFTWWLAPEWLWFSVLLAGLLVMRHVENIRRLATGSEARIGG